jgi:putative tricarboxylic transport membrane protein
MRGLRTFAVTAVALALTVTGCGGSGGGAAGKPITGLRVMVPNSPGGGYDVTARTAAKAAEDAKLARNIEVFNLPGAGGTVGLARLVNEKGNGKLAMSMGLGVVGSVYTNKSKATLQQTTPVARLLQESDIIVVSKDSPYKAIGDLVKAWKADPGKLPVGGGSSPGGPDHLAAMLTAKAAGLVPKDVNYVPYDGGGELLAAILGKQVAFGVSGVGEYADQVKAGQLRVLAVTSAQRVPSVEAPTLKESGIDIDFVNWRGIVAPPGLDAEETTSLRGLIRDLRASKQWKDALARNGWTDAYLEGDQFGAFMKQENERVGSVLKDLGLA